jgi:hypothetical protein
MQHSQPNLDPGTLLKGVEDEYEGSLPFLVVESNGFAPSADWQGKMTHRPPPLRKRR